MSQSSGPRVVAKYVEGIAVTYTAATQIWAIGAVGTASGWTINPSNGTLFWQGYIDISGYRPDDMVLIPTAVQCQYGAPFLSSGATSDDPGGPLYIQYALTTDKIDDIDYTASGVTEALAGFTRDSTTMDQVIFGASEVYGPASNKFYAVQLLQKHTFGDGPAIVGPRIYLAIRCALTIPRNAANSADTDGTYMLPPMRFVIAGEAADIPEFQLLHLMKRQIDLQQTPDVDA